MLSRDDVPTTFDPDLYQALTAALSVGDVVSTLSTGNRNEIAEITERGVHVITDRSAPASSEVPAWMFNVVWRELKANGTFGSADMDRSQLRRSSAVFALLARLPTVEVASSRPIALRLRSDA